MQTLRRRQAPVDDDASVSSFAFMGAVKRASNASRFQHSDLNAMWGGCELDLLVIERGRRIGFEVKFSEAPHVTRTTRTVAETLALDHLFVVCPTPAAYPVDDRITVLPATEVIDLRARIAALRSR